MPLDFVFEQSFANIQTPSHFHKSLVKCADEGSGIDTTTPHDGIITEQWLYSCSKIFCKFVMFNS